MTLFDATIRPSPNERRLSSVVTHAPAAIRERFYGLAAGEWPVRLGLGRP